MPRRKQVLSPIFGAVKPYTGGRCQLQRRFYHRRSHAVTAILKVCSLCQKGQTACKDVPYISDPITPLKEESYLRPAAKPDVQGSTPTPEVPTFSTEDSDEKDNSITLHVSLDLSDLTDAHKDASPQLPENWRSRQKPKAAKRWSPCWLSWTVWLVWTVSSRRPQPDELHQGHKDP